MSALPPEKRARLVQLCGLLGSEFDGERATAGRFAHELLRGLRLTWDDVIAREPAARARPANDWRAPWEREERETWGGRTVREVADHCLKSGAPWSEWERGFLADIRHKSPLSERQGMVLARLYQRALATEQPF